MVTKYYNLPDEDSLIRSLSYDLHTIHVLNVTGSSLDFNFLYQERVVPRVHPTQHTTSFFG